MLGDDVGTRLSRAAYHDAAHALGAEGILVTTEEHRKRTARRFKPGTLCPLDRIPCERAA